MNALLALPIWFFIIFISIGVGLIDRFTIYQNTIIEKTKSWTFLTSAFIIILMTIIFCSFLPIFWNSAKNGVIGQALIIGVVLKFLLLTILLSFSGMAKRARKQFIDFVENI